jgi:hypothetical protein
MQDYHCRLTIKQGDKPQEDVVELRQEPVGEGHYLSRLQVTEPFSMALSDIEKGTSILFIDPHTDFVD